MEPSVGGVGSPQLSGGRKKFTSNNKLCSNLWWADVVVRHKHVAFAFVPRQCVGEKPVYVHFYD